MAAQHFKPAWRHTCPETQEYFALKTSSSIACFQFPDLQPALIQHRQSRLHAIACLGTDTLSPRPVFTMMHLIHRQCRPTTEQRGGGGIDGTHTYRAGHRRHRGSAGRACSILQLRQELAPHTDLREIECRGETRRMKGMGDGGTGAQSNTYEEVTLFGFLCEAHWYRATRTMHPHQGLHAQRQDTWETYIVNHVENQSRKTRRRFYSSQS